MHTVKDYSVSEKGNPPPPLHGLLFAISNKGYFKGNIPQTAVFVIPVVENRLERETV